MNHPWLQFFVGDWLKHPGLRSCSAPARGLAIDLVCLMHQAEPYGHLRVGKKDLGVAELARVVGGSKAEVGSMLQELLDAGVFDRTPEGRVYSPRMVRDEQKRAQSREHGARGGNPKLATPSKPLDNRTPNPADNPSHARARSEVQKSEPIPAASKPRPAAREVTSAHAEARLAWSEVFEKETGSPYPFNGSLDGKQLATLLKLPGFSLDELRRRAVLMLKDRFWAAKGVDLKLFVSKWTALSNAGRNPDAAPEPPELPSEEERVWIRSALKDPNPVLRDEARKRLQRWGLTETDLLEESA